MKVATVTWITYNNYGTVLQAYSLQQYLLCKGVENAILSDRSIVEDASSGGSGVSEQHEAKPLGYYIAHPWHTFMVLLKITTKRIKDVIGRKKLTLFCATQRRITDFKESCLTIDNTVRISGLHELNEKYDAFICGSDQIWSTFVNEPIQYYYLAFAQKSKFSYATSLGTTDINESKKAKIKTLLSDFKGISVREKESAMQLSHLLGRGVEFVADPTLLHDDEFWHDFASHAQLNKLKRKRYIACYFLENKKWYFDYARSVANYMKLDLILIPSRADFMSKPYVCKDTIGPYEFVSLIENADVVLTDSYHGSIFSIIFSKKFVYLKRFKDNDNLSQNLRVYSLFNELEISDNIIDENSFVPTILDALNYGIINEKLRKFRDGSRDYVDNRILI